MNTPLQFPYVLRDPTIGTPSLAPMLPINLVGRQRIPTFGLLDSGAAINVLPYGLGVQLGFVWEEQRQSVVLSGNMVGAEARVVVVSAAVGHFPEVRLAFAWAQADGVPLILGQVNFFMEFNVCFFRSVGLFEVRPRP